MKEGDQEVLKVFLVLVVVRLVATDRSVGVRKSVLVDIRRLRAPTSPLTTPEAPAPSFTRHKRESCCLASLVYPSLSLPHPSLPNFFTIHQPPTNQNHHSCITMASSPLHILASFLTPLSFALGTKVLPALPSLLSTRPRRRRRELTFAFFVCLREFKPTMAFTRTDVEIVSMSPSYRL
jgi:hypothetical protein